MALIYWGGSHLMRKILASTVAAAALTFASAGMAAAAEYDYTGSSTGTYAAVSPQSESFTVPVNTVLPYSFKNVPAGTYSFTVSAFDGTVLKTFSITVGADGAWSTDFTAPSTPTLAGEPLSVSVVLDDAATAEVEAISVFTGSINVTDEGALGTGDEVDETEDPGSGVAGSGEQASNATTTDSGELAAGEELANTGAGNMGLVAGAAGLLVAGAGAVVIAARRRQDG